MMSGLPSAIQAGILRQPAAFMELTARVLEEPEEFFVLVDKQHPLSADYVPPDLVPLKGYPVKATWPGLQLRKAIMPAVLQMVRSARTGGVALTFSSAYRSYEYQTSAPSATTMKTPRKGNGWRAFGRCALACAQKGTDVGDDVRRVGIGVHPDLDQPLLVDDPEWRRVTHVIAAAKLVADLRGKVEIRF
jgi:hypothetical protein